MRHSELPSRLALIAAVAACVALTACGADEGSSAAPASLGAGSSSAGCTPIATGSDSFTEHVPALTTTADGLRYADLVTGTGAVAANGETLTVQYSGWLTNGCPFDSSRQAGRQPFQFVEGAHNVIPGWEEGVLGMHVGSKRRLVIPASLGYGPNGQGTIPPNATLVFDVELLGVSAAAASPS